MVLVQKWAFVQLFFFLGNQPGKYLLRYSRTKRHLCRLKIEEVQTVEKLTFLQRG